MNQPLNGQLPFQPEDAKKLLASREGQQLLQMLNKDGGAALRGAAQALKSGNTQKAQELLSPLLQNEKASALLQALEKKQGRHG